MPTRRTGPARDPRAPLPIGGHRMLAAVHRAAVRPVQAFFRMEAASGVLLLAAAVAALAWVNLAGAASYRALLDARISIGVGPVSAAFTAHQAINDGLMTVFFWLVGMEIKRELVVGELRTRSQALLPAIAALGGMVVPAGIFAALNAGTAGAPGWGIPMATDIAFCIGVLTLLRSRVPQALVVFVTALAIFDDIGGILVIALFYGTGLHAGWLAAAAALTAGLAWMSRRGVRSAAAYVGVGALLWWALHAGGVHATIAGVVLGLAIPARGGDAPLDGLVRRLHPWVAFGIVPLFALANAGVEVRGLGPSQAMGRVATGVAVALLAGKPIGIVAFTLAAVRSGVAAMPGGASVPKVLGVAIVAGIGFTVALFVAALAYPADRALLDQAKLGVLAGSLLAGVLGAAVLRCTAPWTDPVSSERATR